MSWFTRQRGRRTDAVPPSQPLSQRATPPRGPLPEPLRLLAHGDPVPGEWLEWLQTQLVEAAAAAGGDQPPVIALRDLRVRTDGMPDWWCAGGNMLLAGSGAAPVVPELSFAPQQPTHSIALLGNHARVHRMTFMAEGGLIAIGDGVNLWGVSLGVIGQATILIGEHTTATFDGSLDARNGGSIHVGADGMWGAGIRIITDDMHTIRDRDTGQRINARGGRITIEPHVWLAEQVRIMGGCRIGEGTVVGAGSLVTGRDLPDHSVCVGRPARPVRGNIVWTREDLP